MRAFFLSFFYFFYFSSPGQTSIFESPALLAGRKVWPLFESSEAAELSRAT